MSSKTVCSRSSHVTAAPIRDGQGRITGVMEMSANITQIRDLEGRLTRPPVLLRHQQGLTYTEIARAMQLPEGTAKTLVHRGMLILRAGCAPKRSSS